MTSNRPFFSNFLSAFRARSGVQKASTSANGAVSGASLSSAYAQAAAAAQAQAQANTQTQTQAQTSTSSQIVSKANISTGTLGNMKDTSNTSTSPPAATSTAFSPPRHHRHHHHQVHHIPKAASSHPTPPLSRSPGPSNSPSNHTPFGSYPRQRRESDSSSEGFREVLGADKWYIGGRTATGEERFYKLGIVRRPRSLDRVSLDRISL